MRTKPVLSRLSTEPPDQSGCGRIACKKQHPKDYDRQKGIQVLIPEQYTCNRRRNHEWRENQRRERVGHMATVPAEDADFQCTHDHLVDMQPIRG